MRGKYLAFGLVFDSPISLPEAYPADPGAEADVTIACGTAGEGFPTDGHFGKAREERLWWQGMPDESRTLFNCPAGLYEIHGGREIIIQPYADAHPEQVKIYLLGSAMGAVQIQRSRIPVHGGAVATSRGALILTGAQGGGKSSMTSAFVRNGYRYLTDDVSSVSIENDLAHIVPAYPQRKLVRDACAPLGYDPGNLVLVDKVRDKFAVRDRENWQREPMPLSTIIEIYPETREKSIAVDLVTGLDKLACVSRNLYRMWMHIPTGDMKPDVFKKILAVAAQADIYRVGVPRDIERIVPIARDIAAALGVQSI